MTVFPISKAVEVRIRALSQIEQHCVNYMAMTGRDRTAFDRHMRRCERLGHQSTKWSALDVIYEWERRYKAGWRYSRLRHIKIETRVDIDTLRKGTQDAR